MKHKKLLAAQHTGKVRHHKHTSYSGLAVALLLTFCLLLVASRAAVFASGDPVTASESVYAVVAAETPKTAPVITSTSSGTTYTDSNPVVIAGTCPADTLIKVFKNEVFSGATLCQNGRFSLPIDLFLGSNTIIVRAYNATNNVGPESTVIVLQKNIAGIDISTANQQFFVTSEIYFKGVNAGNRLSWPVTLAGGNPPYAVNIAWGDGKTDLISRSTAGAFDVSHVYESPGDGYKGTYDVTISATDAAGNKSFIHLVSIVGGVDSSVVSGVKQSYNWSGTFRIASQLLVTAALLVLAFWLGERRELRSIKKRMNAA